MHFPCKSQTPCRVQLYRYSPFSIASPLLHFPSSDARPSSKVAIPRNLLVQEAFVLPNWNSRPARFRDKVALIRQRKGEILAWYSGESSLGTILLGESSARAHSQRPRTCRGAGVAILYLFWKRSYILKTVMFSALRDMTILENCDYTGRCVLPRSQRNPARSLDGV